MQSLLGYHFDEVKEFLKIYVAMPSLVPSVKRYLDDGINVSGYGTLRGLTYESNVPFVLRFMIDNNISGADWIELPATTYSIITNNNNNNNSNNGNNYYNSNIQEQISRCTIEVNIFYNHIISHECINQWSIIAPLRILSFDIECQGRKGHFPDANFDPVIQIANLITIQGEEKAIIRNVFTLNTCLPIVGIQVICCSSEEELLLKWRSFVITCDPDIITGYNISNFDFPYLLNRAKVCW